MHVLVVNDDGPPSQKSSPYVHSFISTLQSHGHTVSVVLPNIQRSWIGKAHFAGRKVTPTYFHPGTLHTDDGTTHTRPRTDGGEEWVLIDGTPASCTQIGLNHYFKERGKIDLVVSGPNYGRNSTSLFSLSSGTIGGAMEGAVCGVKSVALSYAFFSRNHDPVIIKGGSNIGARVVEHLYKNWTPGVDLYTVNVPLIEGIDSVDTKVLYTNILQNYWTMGSSFEEVEADDEVDPDEREMEIRGASEGEGGLEGKTVGLKHKAFMWAPKFADMYRSVDESEPGNDGWAVKMGHVSVTPLKANFMHVGGLEGGEIKLEPRTQATLAVGAVKPQEPPYYAVVDYEDDYVRPRIINALKQKIPEIQIIDDAASVSQEPRAKILYWSAYEKIPFEDVLSQPSNVLCCSYIIRKALIRKHYLSHTLTSWITKHPTSILSTASSTTCELELDYAEYLDEALVEAYELRDSLAGNEDKIGGQRQWWILKPGMSDRGQGIRLFSTLGELEAVFEEFEEESDEEEDEDGSGDETADGWGVEGGKVVQISDAAASSGNDSRTSVVTSQLRHFVAQAYIHPPLLIDDKKFHIRTYVLSVGGLRVYVYREMLALFAAKVYVPPWQESSDLVGHLTNTCLQSGEREGSVRLFWELEKDLAGKGGKEVLEGVWAKIQKIVGETWEAASRGQRIHFQTLPNAFEIFGVDFLVDADMGVYLLEVNSYPDFKQTGENLGVVIDGLFEGAVENSVKGFFGKKVGQEGWGIEGDNYGKRGGNMVKVLDVELGSW